MKKFFSALLAVMIIMTLAVTTFAAETGSITVKKTVKDQYNPIYMMATLDEYDANKGAYLYTPVAEWKAFFDAYTDAYATGDKIYFEYNAGNIILVKDDLSADETAAFAKAALAYADANDIAIVGEAKTASADNEDVVFDDLTLGYYLVDSSLGAFCGLTTTAPNAEVNEKNASPTIDKFVEEDSLVDDGIDDNEWGKVNDADMFQDINYKTIVTVQKGAMNYVLHDKMDAGLTWKGTVTVTVDGSTVTAGDDTYTLVSDPADDDCTFEIKFADSYVETLAAETQIIVTYSAFLNEDAVIYIEENDTNNNQTWLGYGDSNRVECEPTKTKTYQFAFVKTDAEGKVLDGAKFKLYDSATEGKEIKVINVEDGVDGVYRLAETGEDGVDIKTVGGIATIVGLDGNNTIYYIDEIEAPAGYNKLTIREDVTIGENSLGVVVNEGVFENGMQIINQTGSVLPETGGLGTVLFVVFGGIVVLGAGVLLFAKKRMSQIAE